MLRTRFRILFLWLLAVSVPIPAVANPGNRTAFGRYFGDFLPESLQGCAACHVSDEAQGAQSLDEFPHNPFGDRLREVGEALAADGSDDSIRSRLLVIADEDADDDGVSNLHEVLLGTAPGNPDDVPDDEQKGRLAERSHSFQEFKSQYQWEPFRPVERPGVPEVAADWGRNGIDAFIAARHERLGLNPRPEAAPETLLRRLHLDLTGLAPTPQQVRTFVAEYARDPEAYGRAVDRLLESPAYGERWGRHWMDVWRYSDWAGYRDQLRESQRHIWHWRDWIVESLNADMGYDQMIVQMLAADEAVPDDHQAQRATGFLARNYFRNRDQWMDNVVTHTAQGFLGITMGCAKCHDHMYDPIAQDEYYKMRAIFEPYHVRTDRVSGVLDRGADGIPRAYDKSLGAKTFVFDGGDERYPLKDNPVEPGVPASLGGDYAVDAVDLPLTASQPDRREFVRQDLLKKAEQSVAKAKDDQLRQAAQRRLAILKAELEVERLEDAGKQDQPEWTAAAKRVFELQREANLADARRKLAQAETALEKAQTDLDQATDGKKEAQAKKAHAAAKKKLDTAKAEVAKCEKAMQAEVTTKFARRAQEKFPATSTGRRLAFARWITGKQNPLTARVAMNHIWLRHFDRPIVPTPNEFGGNGRPPTHPALLDWLAAEFMARGWSMKQMHRLIVTSATWRMASTPDPQNAAIDPDNVEYWRGTSRRMEGEIVRDNLLHVAGLLDPKMGGPDIDNKLAQKSKRRSIYLRHAHEKLVEFVQIFDGPSVSECYMREESVQPHQALALANSKLTVNAADVISTELASAHEGRPDQLIDEAFLRILGRSPRPEELSLCRDFLLDDQAQPPPDMNQRAVRNLVLVLLNHNDFITIR